MYKIVGADSRTYGPVPVETVREWITAGRANAQTMAQVEGSAEWKPLSQFPEFASLTSIPALPPLIPSLDQRKSKLVAGLLGILVGWAGVHRFYLGYTAIGVAQIIVSLLTCFTVGWIWGLIEGILILVGSTITTDVDGRPLKEV